MYAQDLVISVCLVAFGLGVILSGLFVDTIHAAARARIRRRLITAAYLCGRQDQALRFAPPAYDELEKRVAEVEEDDIAANFPDPMSTPEAGDTT